MGLLSRIDKFLKVDFKELPDAPLLNQRQERGLAMGAPYAAEGILPINALTLDAGIKAPRRLLAQAWGVHGPQDVDDAYSYLFQTGHRMYYAIVAPKVQEYVTLYARKAKRKELKDVVLRQQQQAASEAMSIGLDPAEVEGYRMSWLSCAFHWAKDLPDPLPASISAWDAARIVHISKLMVDAEYVSSERAWQVIAAAVDLFRPEYNSWAQFADGFLTGRAFWAGHRQGTVEKDVSPFKVANAQLLEDPASPWLRIPY